MRLHVGTMLGRFRVRANRTVLFGGATTVALVAFGGMALGWLPTTRPAPSPAARFDLPPAIHTWIWHAHKDVPERRAPLYRDLLAVLPPDVAVLVLAEDMDTVARFRRTLGPFANDRRLVFELVGASITPWARDHALLFEDAAGPVALYPPEKLIPRHHAGILGLPAALDRLGVRLTRREAAFYVQGGDVSLARTRVFTSRSSGVTNQGVLELPSHEFHRRLGAAVGREVVVVGKGVPFLPHEHLDMYATVLDDRTVALADPRLGLEVFADSSAPTRGEAPHRGHRTVSWRSGQVVLARIYDAFAEGTPAPGARGPALADPPRGGEADGEAGRDPHLQQRRARAA